MEWIESGGGILGFGWWRQEIWGAAAVAKAHDGGGVCRGSAYIALGMSHGWKEEIGSSSISAKEGKR